MKKKIAVLISGEGQTLQAIINACNVGELNAEIVTVISNKANIYGLQRAKNANIPTHTFLRKNFADNQQMDKAIGDLLEQYQVDLIVLAGYMKILTAEFTQRFAGKILNTHPSLLPKYPGLHTYQRALENHDTEHGFSVHFVNEEMDGGQLVFQFKLPILADDTEESLSARVKFYEQRYYPQVINWFVEQRLVFRDQAYFDNQPLLSPIVKSLSDAE
ncbi:phosphoribosylglycinamide formyltransferase [Gallibacterium genomosp. 3]|uniref:Phosphoribosylglycinamide formyltransferase n=1 Tax=Gallibacterium genomosp. 3 TaxID=505345 RepID=A0A1A7NM23_9PAST|nr:phosphoribosylglycinamide formyltransferase [Gallibacterium genomosp. 3]OBW91177.1 phosphoribosylglycinamide formyltransferase [Gallibacterium genomosp. 3]